MSIQDINQYKQDRLMVDGEWASDTMTCVLYGMENRQPVSSFHNGMIEQLEEYKRLVEIGCEYAWETKNSIAAQELDHAVGEDARILWGSRGIQAGRIPLYTVYHRSVITMLWECSMMPKTIIDQIERTTRV